MPLKNKKIKILLVIYGDVHFGGVSVLLNNLLANMDRSDFDFTLYAFGKVTDEEIYKSYTDKGVRVILGMQDRYNDKKFAWDLIRILIKGRYDIIHCNTGALGMTVVSLSHAKLFGVKTRIGHSHSKKNIDTPYTDREKLAQKKNNGLATVKLACSAEASEHLFGNKEAMILQNGIDAERFSFSKEKRDFVRAKLGLEGKLVIGTVGRLEPIKNQSFILDIAKCIKAKRDMAAIIVGSGSLKDELASYSKKLGIEENVVFVEANNHIEDYLNAMDAFLLPSYAEGLGISAVEAQSMDLPTWCSTKVPDLVSVTEKVHFMDIDDGAEHWSENILAALENIDLEARTGRRQDVIDKGYDIKTSAQILEKLYRVR